MVICILRGIQTNHHKIILAFRGLSFLSSGKYTESSRRNCNLEPHVIEHSIKVKPSCNHSCSTNVQMEKILLRLKIKMKQIYHLTEFSKVRVGHLSEKGQTVNISSFMDPLVSIPMTQLCH